MVSGVMCGSSYRVCTVKRKVMYNENETVHLSIQFGCSVGFPFYENNGLSNNRQFRHLTGAFVGIF